MPRDVRRAKRGPKEPRLLVGCGLWYRVDGPGCMSMWDVGVRMVEGPRVSCVSVSPTETVPPGGALMGTCILVFARAHEHTHTHARARPRKKMNPNERVR